MWPYEDHFKVQRGRFVISNTDTSQGRGEHWLTFYFSKLGPYDFFDSLGHMREENAVGFDKVVNKKCFKNVGQLQQSTSNVCELYCAYFVMIRHASKTMKDILKYLNPTRKRNDRFLVSNMRRGPTITRLR